MIPGPVGSAAAGISAVAYAATGNKRKALEMTAMVGAAFVGAGAIVGAIKHGGAAIKIGAAAVRSAPRAARAVVAQVRKSAAALKNAPDRGSIGRLLSVNQMNQANKCGTAPPGFTRIDAAKVKGEQRMRTSATELL